MTSQRVVIIQLCLVLAALLLRCADWRSVVEFRAQPLAKPLADLLALLGGGNSGGSGAGGGASAGAALYVVQTVAMLPEEIRSKHLSLPPMQVRSPYSPSSRTYTQISKSK